jgi:hypothetical protein
MRAEAALSLLLSLQAYLGEAGLARADLEDGVDMEFRGSLETNKQKESEQREWDSARLHKTAVHVTRGHFSPMNKPIRMHTLTHMPAHRIYIHTHTHIPIHIYIYIYHRGQVISHSVADD